MRVVFVGQAAILLALSGWSAVWPARTALALAAQAGGLVLASLALARFGVWLFPPWWSPYAAAAVIVAQALRRALSDAPEVARPRNARAYASIALYAAITVVCGGLLFHLCAARRLPQPERSVSLASPLPDGRYLVVNGGGSSLINAHRASMDRSNARLQPWRGNGHAVDIVAIDALGFRARGLLPRDPTAYDIFGTPVLSPCSGVVIQAVDGHVDHAPPQFDAANPAGNHVMLDCGGARVVLAHLKQGSLRVSVGQSVTAGAPLGAVGNSGGTDEPHLHIHAQRPGPPDAPMAGDPLPMLIEGRYLVRGDRISGRGSTAR